MTRLILALCALLSLAVGQSPYNDRFSGGIGSGSWYRGGGMSGSGGPFVTTTTVTTVLDLSTGMTKTFHSSNNPSSGGSSGGERYSSYGGGYGGGEKNKFTEGSSGTSPLMNILSENDISVLVNSWHILKKRSDFAPKVFMRYFKAKPEAQKLFSEFANVSVTDLPNNHDFLNAAYSCISSLEFILPHLRFQHPERCPALTDLKNKYSVVDLKRFVPIWMAAMQEEMGNAYSNEVRDVWKKAFSAFTDYASTP
ncbi:hypothetical protein DAPPUDRAFT_223072 [Daphnia pulex]|uniref:Globin domain-containing protein n=1 Tax=Daphnia pulex TaxID=6669 RepID=E9G8K3_DAPPU|nr:hypothetical protein DAPPUDRAFT_223072 [Daphnia pulex]|eukprot:EFX84256.1 hypothetical protein DAPPUDRAFT_223072 [Daphnia pulex]